MRILGLQSNLLTEIAFLNAVRGQESPAAALLPVHTGQVSDLPAGLDAIVVTADLQGRERFEDASGAPPRLLGEVVAEQLVLELLPSLNVLPERTGVILAGDFYTVPGLGKRGGQGDVTSVWQSFATWFCWVAGVAGNHDVFGGAAAPAAPIATNSHVLDGASVLVNGLTVAGIGGIIGNPRKLQRRTEVKYLELLDSLVCTKPDVLVMHDGPDDPLHDQHGIPTIRASLERGQVPLVIRGHTHWEQPLTELENGTQILNVDCRLVILHR